MRVLLALLWLMVLTVVPVWSDPASVRRELVQALQGNERLQRACLDNIKNVNTVGYRGTDLFAFLQKPGAARFRLHMTTGTLRETKSPWDVAIDGDGFFCLEGGRLSRAGSFHLDEQGRLSTTDGLLVLSGQAPEQLQPVPIPGDVSDLRIGADGAITGVRINGDGKEESIAQLYIARVPQPIWLKRQGVHLLPTRESGRPHFAVPGAGGAGVLSQGYVELSNTTLLEDLEVLRALRTYAGLFVGAEPDTSAASDR